MASQQLNLIKQIPIIQNLIFRSYNTAVESNEKILIFELSQYHSCKVLWNKSKWFITYLLKLASASQQPILIKQIQIIQIIKQPSLEKNYLLKKIFDLKFNLNLGSAVVKSDKMTWNNLEF